MIGKSVSSSSPAPTMTVICLGTDLKEWLPTVNNDLNYSSQKVTEHDDNATEEYGCLKEVDGERVEMTQEDGTDVRIGRIPNCHFSCGF